MAVRLAPLRHRSTRIFGAVGVDCRWPLHALDHCQLDSRRALDLLRLLQEALTNALRHSQAKRVEISIVARGPDELTLTVVDNGRGLLIDVAEAPGFGLASMRTRARRIRGELTLESTAGCTTVRLQMPIKDGEVTTDIQT